jgi:hypothetical protein
MSGPTLKLLRMRVPQIVAPAGISLRFDSDAAVAAATRRKLLEDAARNGYVVAPDHLPFPGFGHIRKNGHSYTWVPVDYVNDAVAK